MTTLPRLLVCAAAAAVGCAPAAPPRPSPWSTPEPMGKPSLEPEPRPAASLADAGTTPPRGPSPEEKAIVAALDKEHAALAACHEASKHAEGDMTIRVTIGVNGKVEATALESEGASVPPALMECIEKHVRTLRVEARPVTLPIRFRFHSNAFDGHLIQYGSSDAGSNF